MPKDNPLYIKYHDEEWGVPVHEDKKHFEFLILEGAQAGLSWLTILKRREGYRKAFANFAPKKVAKFTEEDFVRLLNDPGIIRNKLKIRAAINNAQKFLEIQKEFGSFDKYIWSFVASPPPYRRGKGGGQQVPSLEPALAADRGGLGRVMPINHHLRTLAHEVADLGVGAHGDHPSASGRQGRSVEDSVIRRHDVAAQQNQVGGLNGIARAGRSGQHEKEGKQERRTGADAG